MLSIHTEVKDFGQEDEVNYETDEIIRYLFYKEHLYEELEAEICQKN